MINNFLVLHDNLVKSDTRFNKKEFQSIFQKYLFYHISGDSTLKEEEEQQIFHNINETKEIMFDQNEKLNEETNNRYLIISFERTLIIVEHTLAVNFVYKLFSTNFKLMVCFLSNSKTLIENAITIKQGEIFPSKIFLKEIENFKAGLQIDKGEDSIKNIWAMLIQCISGYLIQKSYLKNRINRIQNFINNYDSDKEIITETINENDYIELRTVGYGSLFICNLIYHIKRGDLYVIKKPNINDEELPKLIKREGLNYSKIKHPFIPKFYGRTKNKDEIVIDFINGKTLSHINEMQLSFNDRLAIVFELMMTIKYFHDNNYLYRDLKPNNVIIDENKTAVIIDFDRLIEYNIDNKDVKMTLDLSSPFLAPETIEEGKFSYESDVYSLGKMIEYIMDTDEFRNYQSIQKLINLILNERPSISTIVQKFISEFKSKILIENLFENLQVHFDNLEAIINFNKNKNDPEIQYKLGVVYCKGQYVIRNVNKAAYFFSLASNQNHLKAQLYLGFIYIDGRYISRDIGKAIHYYSLAANQNDLQAQYNLGAIYYEGKYVERNMNKAIHYFSLAADQNFIQAQYNLGTIYYEGKYVECDINKAIHYYSLAANQNDPQAQYNLGAIYYEGKYAERNINKAIHYFSIAANQNLMQAQYNLGIIYNEGKHVECDISKAIYYYSLAANQNDLQSQFNLAKIYDDEKCALHDINKAIYYYSLAANHNFVLELFIMNVN